MSISTTGKRPDRGDLNFIHAGRIVRYVVLPGRNKTGASVSTGAAAWLRKWESRCARAEGRGLTTNTEAVHGRLLNGDIAKMSKAGRFAPPPLKWRSPWRSERRQVIRRTVQQVQMVDNQL